MPQPLHGPSVPKAQGAKTRALEDDQVYYNPFQLSKRGAGGSLALILPVLKSKQREQTAKKAKLAGTRPAHNESEPEKGMSAVASESTQRVCQTTNQKPTIFIDSTS
jgi:hypothetical protein